MAFQDSLCPCFQSTHLSSQFSGSFAGVWTTSTCQDIEGFPKLLYTTTQWLGIRDRPQYEGCEFIEHGIERCEVTVYIGKSENSPCVDGWSTTAYGFRFSDTYQAVAYKALRNLSQIYADSLARTPMRFFPPTDRDSPFWRARMEVLEKHRLQEDEPTVVSLATYLLALDEHHDYLASVLRAYITRAEESDLYIRKLQVSLATARAQAVSAESRETVTAEAMREAEDRFAKQLRDVYLTARDHRRTLAPGEQPPRILQGIPLCPWGRERPVAPPPTPMEIPEVESPIPCTQPSPAAASQTSSREALCLDEVD